MTDYIANGETLIVLNEWSRAEKAFYNAIESNPSDWRAWFGLARVRTKNFSDIDDKSHLDFLNKALIVANEQDKARIEELYSDFKERVNKLNNLNDSLKKLDDEFDASLIKVNGFRFLKRLCLVNNIVFGLFLVMSIACLIAFWESDNRFTFFLCALGFTGFLCFGIFLLLTINGYKIPSNMTKKRMERVIRQPFNAQFLLGTFKAQIIIDIYKRAINLINQAKNI